MNNAEEMLGIIIREEREQVGFSQKQLAAVTGLSLGIIKEIETGNLPINLRQVFAICEALKISPQYMADRLDRGIESD